MSSSGFTHTENSAIVEERLVGRRPEERAAHRLGRRLIVVRALAEIDGANEERQSL